MIIRPFYEGKVTLDKSTLGIAGIKSVHEPAVKKTFRKILQDGVITSSGDEKFYERVNNFINSDNVYFTGSVFRDEELNEFRDLIIRISDEFNEYKFRIHKEMLEEQLVVAEHHQM